MVKRDTLVRKTQTTVLPMPGLWHRTSILSSLSPGSLIYTMEIIVLDTYLILLFQSLQKVNIAMDTPSICGVFYVLGPVLGSGIARMHKNRHSVELFIV